MTAALPLELSRFKAAEYSSSSDADLLSTPINTAWIIAGAPVARTKVLHETADQRYVVALWDCTAGIFRWHFDYDEVVHILEGEVLVREDDGNQRVLRAGDIALFPKGATNVWTVSQYVRKIAINRYHFPTPVEMIKSVLRKPYHALRKLMA